LIQKTFSFQAFHIQSSSRQPVRYSFVMRKKVFARRLAHEAQLTPAVAADQIDSVVTQLLRRLKEGKPAEIPGFGTLLPGEAVTFLPEKETRKK